MTFMLGATHAQIKKAEIVATGLTCSMCSNSINKQLKSISALDSVAIDLNTNTFTVYVAENEAISPYTLKSKVEKAGFFVGSMTVYLAPGTQLPDNYILLDGKIDKTLSQVRIQVLDKGYLTAKEYKKVSKKFKNHPSLQLPNEDDFHIIVL